MLNKKAIAALAAGATLVSGLAFAAPAMAEEPGAGAQNPPAENKPAENKPAENKPAAQDEKDDNWQYETEDPGALADRLNAEKAAKVAADEKDKYEHTPFGNMDTDYKKCVKLYGEDSLECKAVADYLKRHGQNVDDTAAVKESDKKAGKKAGKKAAAPLAKTGAAVALAAVAASVLAGMGAALRKIRH
ncbi:peptidase [Gardnerella swidsinskii]|uniref:peptidase n=1 Tax=Gardnerella swidsinskii TaxID=2792979 RepID=UPI002A280397|nr:peptidase [Gardnerella swidsinskii]MDK7093700.1 peptidase [Gardnerella swidsinskii]